MEKYISKKYLLDNLRNFKSEILDPKYESPILLDTGKFNTLLSPTGAAGILGISAKGKSEQDTSNKVTSVVQGSLNGGDGTEASATNRLRTNYIAVDNSKTYTISCTSCEVRTIYWYTSSKAFSKYDLTSGTSVSITPTTDGYIRILFRKTDDSTITPSDSYKISCVPTPTPTSPIPIIDASEEVTAHTINLFDKSNSAYILDAYINTTSKVITSNANSKVVYIPCKPNTTYTVSKLVGSRFAVGCINKEPQLNYVADAISANASASSITFTTNADAKYLLAWVWYNDTVSADEMLASVQIEEGDTATSYVPYASNTITLPYTLRSVGTVADELIVNEDGSGKLIQRVGVVDLASLNWTYEADNRRFSASENTHKQTNRETKMLCSAYMAKSNGEAYSADWDNVIYVGGVNLKIHNHALTTPSALVASLADVVCYVELAAPIFITLTAEQVASIRQLMTYKGTTVIASQLEGTVTYVANEDLGFIISSVPKTTVVNNLTSDDTGKALSARQGKELKSLIDAINTTLNNLEILDEEGL